MSQQIADIVRIRRWADCHAFRMLVWLYYGAAVDEEHDEVIAFHAAAVIVQPLVDRGKQYGSVAGALESLLPTLHFGLTDITATPWPN
ncbi:MAG: hypothetical protein ABSC06_20595 [Rhodopila sp.]|jgi:hypothetical protein